MDVNDGIIRRGMPAGVLWGALGVAVWAGLTVMLGGGSAHADDGDDNALDSLTSLVGGTVSDITEPLAPVVADVVAPIVETVVAPVTQTPPPVVETVVETVAPIPVVGTVTAPVVETVSETVGTVTAPVVDVLTDAPLTSVTQPVVDVVTEIPVVGDLLGDLGVTDLIETVIGVVDDTTAVIGTVVPDVVDPVTDTPDPVDTDTDAPADGTDGTATGELATPPVPITALSSSDPRASRSTPIPALLPATGADSAESAAWACSPIGGAPPQPERPPVGPSAPSSSAGAGGSSSFAPALLGDVSVLPSPAAQRESRASDDAVPTSRVGDTDVSPD